MRLWAALFHSPPLKRCRLLDLCWAWRVFWPPPSLSTSFRFCNCDRCFFHLVFYVLFWLPGWTSWGAVQSEPTWPMCPPTVSLFRPTAFLLPSAAYSFCQDALLAVRTIFVLKERSIPIVFHCSVFTSPTDYPNPRLWAFNKKRNMVFSYIVKNNLGLRKRWIKKKIEKRNNDETS